MTPPTPEAIEAACIAYVGLPGIDAEREWSRYSSHSQAAIRQQIRAALAACESAMEAAGFVRLPVEPTRSESEALFKEAQASERVLRAIYASLCDREVLSILPLELASELEAIDERPTLACRRGAKMIDAMIAARPSANKGEK